MLLWFLIGLIAGFLDYAFALGFGLISSIMLIGLMGFDVKDVVPIITMTQVITSVPAFLFHLRTGNVKVKPPKELVRFILFSSIFAFLIPPIISVTSEEVRYFLYVLMLTLLPVTVKIRSRSVLFYSFLAGLDKAVIGGGLSLVIISMELSLGIDLRTAIALMPLIKLMPTVFTTISYIMITSVDVAKLICMSLGAFIASYLASRTLRRVKVSEDLLTTIVILVLILGLIRRVLAR